MKHIYRPDLPHISLPLCNVSYYVKQSHKTSSHFLGLLRRYGSLLHPFRLGHERYGQCPLNFSWRGPEEHGYVFSSFPVQAISHTNTKAMRVMYSLEKTGLVGMALPNRSGDRPRHFPSSSFSSSRRSPPVQCVLSRYRRWKRGTSGFLLIFHVRGLGVSIFVCIDIRMCLWLFRFFRVLFSTLHVPIDVCHEESRCDIRKDLFFSVYVSLFRLYL